MTTEKTHKGIKGPYVIAGFFAAVGAMALLAFHPPREKDEIRKTVVVPQLTPSQAQGQVAFNRACSDCHGENARGSAKGPSLIHSVYWPEFHADGAFRVAIKKGVRAHHWGFGDMPAQADKVSDTEVEDIIAFVRALQRANPKEE